jgi:hypothetical protein
MGFSASLIRFGGKKVTKTGKSTKRKKSKHRCPEITCQSLAKSVIFGYTDTLPIRLFQNRRRQNGGPSALRRSFGTAL